MWTTNPETPAGEAVRPTDKAPRCRAAARTRAGDSGRERCRASVGRPAARRVRDDANARAGRQGSEGRRRRGAQKNAEAVGPLQQDADASSEDERWKDVLVVQIGRKAQFRQCDAGPLRALFEEARRLCPLLL